MNTQELTKRVDELNNTFSAKNWKHYREMLAPDVVYDEKATGRRIQGADKVIEALQGWTTSFPDLHAIPKQMVVSGNTVICEAVFEGTQTGPLVGPMGTIPPSGKHGMVETAQVFTFEGDKLKELHQYFDMVTILRQVGALPATMA